MKLIIGPLSIEQTKDIFDNLMSREYRCMSDDTSLLPTGNAIRISHDSNNPDKCTFRIGNYDKYVKYITSKNKDYSTDVIYNYDYYKSNMMSKILNNVEQIGKIDSKAVKEEVITDTIILTKQNVLNTYKLSSTELQIFMRNLFGEDMFKETTYKVGDWFEYSNSKFVLTRINKDVVTLIDTRTYENYSLARAVKNINKITEHELRSLIGVNYDKFKLIR
jgi:hypothetical protein